MIKQHNMSRKLAHITMSIKFTESMSSKLPYLSNLQHESYHFLTVSTILVIKSHLTCICVLLNFKSYLLLQLIED